MTPEQQERKLVTQLIEQIKLAHRASYFGQKNAVVLRREDWDAIAELTFGIMRLRDGTHYKDLLQKWAEGGEHMRGCASTSDQPCDCGFTEARQVLGLE